MRYPILICLLAGCGLTDDPDMRELKNSLRITGEEVTAKQDESLVILKEQTTALAAIKSQVESTEQSTEQIHRALEALVVKSEAPKAEEEVIKSALEPQETAQANPSHTSQPVALSPAVRLFVATTSNCPPCERLKNAVDSGEFDGFAVTYDDGFSGLRSYPAIRFADATSATGWRVVYGYDSGTVQRLRELTGTKGFVSEPLTTNSVVTHSELVAIHNSLHGGGQWTWPGDLATHLKTTHGYAVKSQSVTVVNRGTSCPNGRCPTSRRGLSRLFR